MPLLNRLERFIQRHIRNRSTNQITGNSLFSSEIILKLDGDTELARALKVYVTDYFLFSRLNFPNVLISVAKKFFFHSDFPFPCFDVPKASNFTSGGVQNCEAKNRGLGTIVTSIQDSKPREKQISPTFSHFLIYNALLYHFLAN